MQPASSYEVYATILNRGQTRRTIAVMFRGMLRQARQEVGVAVCASFSVLEGIVERGEELEPPLDSDIVVPHYAYAFQALWSENGTWCFKGSQGDVLEPRRCRQPPNQEGSNAFSSRA